MKKVVAALLGCTLIAVLGIRMRPFGISEAHDGRLTPSIPAAPSSLSGPGVRATPVAVGPAPSPPPSAPVVARERGQAEPEDPVALVLSRHPDLHEYHALAVKSLLTQRERERLGVLLASPRRIEQAEFVLLGDGVQTLSDADETARMMYTDYLMSAMAWDNNPARSTVVQTIVSVVNTDNLDPSLPEDLRKSRAGDKVELFTKLFKREPKVAEALEADAKDSPRIQKILAYARVEAANRAFDATAQSSIAADVEN